MQDDQSGALAKLRARLATQGLLTSVILPLAAILTLSLVTGVLLDNVAAGHRGSWPEPLYWLARQVQQRHSTH